MSSFAYGRIVMFSFKTKFYNVQFRVFCSICITNGIFSVSIDLCTQSNTLQIVNVLSKKKI